MNYLALDEFDWTHYRHRLIIAALVLLALGGGVWWSMRPRIDPRLVGLWEIDGSFTTGMIETEFCPDGTTQPDDDSLAWRYQWRVAGRMLHLNGFDRKQDGLNSIEKRLGQAYWGVRYWWSGEKIRKAATFSDEVYEILEMSPTEVKLRNLAPLTEHSEFVTLRKFAEGMTLNHIFVEGKDSTIRPDWQRPGRNALVPESARAPRDTH